MGDERWNLYDDVMRCIGSRVIKRTEPDFCKKMTWKGKKCFRHNDIAHDRRNMSGV